MRIAAVLMAWLVTGLSVYPCSDQIGGEVCVEVVGAGHSDEGAEPEGCSPWCVCSCCHVPVVSVAAAEEMGEVERVECRVGEYYEERVGVKVPLSVWRPPWA